MIWSCEINYSGWEDDIHHHHLFIEDDTKPSEQAVVDCYNAHYYNPDDRKIDERIEPLEDDECFNWQAVEPNGYSYDNVRIIIKPLKTYITKSGEIRWG